MADSWLAAHPLVLVAIYVAALVAAIHEGRERP
jgi:hypothetical protein